MTAPPHATYRLQLTPGFGFDDAAAVADYLARLGISHLFASPYLQAAPGSTHGYDVVDHSRVNEELGGAAGHQRMCAALARAGLGQVLDIVPNHMAIGVRANRWWWDVLENGPSSVYASYFDVNWDPPEHKLRNTVLLPILGDHYGRVLERGELSLTREGGAFTVRYFDHELPVAPPTLDSLLTTASERCASAELESLAEALGRLPPSSSTDRASVRERHRDKEVLRERLERLCAEDPIVAGAVDAVAAEVAADADAFDVLMERQNYRLAFWRTAQRELDYRRFFDINTLIGLHAEDSNVFQDTHALILQWVADGTVDGLRVDHPDGLRDPRGYFARLAEATAGSWVAVEKILEPGESLPSTWPVAGTTGYDFMNLLLGVFIDGAHEAAFTSVHADLTGDGRTYHEILVEKKLLIMHTVLAADLIRLTALFGEVCERHRRYRDYPSSDLHEVLREVIASFPVYRTYVEADTGQVGDADVAHVDAAVRATRERRPDLDADLLDFLRDLLVLRVRGPEAPGLPGADAAAGPETELVMRFQQLTGPVMAKGAEDTAFYVYSRFVALNEVGGDPAVFAVDVGELHRRNQAVLETWPHAMLASSTHDTKRSEDVRYRLAALSEVPDRWATFARRWVTEGAVLATDQLLFLQTAVGAWPLDAGRAKAYMEKATKEAKLRTSWIDPAPDYDAAVADHVDRRLADPVFVADLERLVDVVRGPGRVTSLAATLVKLTSPGVADTYQGTDLWDLSLVDPDNRRPVDFDLRRRLLGELEDGMTPEQVWARVDEGLPKLWVIRQALHARVAGSYVPLTPAGEAAGHVVGFVRGDRHATVVPRLPLGLERSGGWGSTQVTLPAGEWRNLLTGDSFGDGELLVADLLARFPVALLERTASER